MNEAVVNLRLSVSVPIGTSAETVARALNAALDEPPCNWGAWVVGAVVPEGRNHELLTEVLWRAAADLWLSTDSADPYDILSQRQKEALDVAARMRLGELGEDNDT